MMRSHLLCYNVAADTKLTCCNEHNYHSEQFVKCANNLLRWDT